MSHPRVPADLLDHIVDHLHDTRDALKSCCLTSRSWVPRTRKHLFADISFHTEKLLQSWKSAFPDPSTSPAWYTKSLAILYTGKITATDAEECSWITTFSRVVDFDLEFEGPEMSLLPFHGFSPALKSLRIHYPHFPLSRILNLVHSFPLIEDLSLISRGDDPIDDIDGQHAAVQPPLTGSLQLSALDGMDCIVSRLFPPHNGLHFRELDLWPNRENDLLVISALVERCRFTLESLKVHTGFCYQPSLGPIDLSKATQLKDVKFRWECHPRWAVEALRTVTHDNRNLQQLSLEAGEECHGPRVGGNNPGDPFGHIGESSYQEWLELDSVLVQLWESHSIRPEVEYNVPRWTDEGAGRRMQKLLPEVTARGIVDLIEQIDE